VDVLKVCDLSEGEHIEREIALVKARAAGGARDELKRLADIFRGQIVDVTPELYTVQLVGTSEKLDAFIKTAAQTNEIIEVVRSGGCGQHPYRRPHLPATLPDTKKGSEEPLNSYFHIRPHQGRRDLSAREMPQTPERTTSMISLVWAAVLMKASSFSLVPTSCTV
jgi:hypothetical protein